MFEAEQEPEVRAADIAIIGMAGRFPGAPDVERFWDNLRQGVESIARIAPEELEESLLVPRAVQARREFVPAGGILGDGDRFDHAFFGVTPAEARRMNPQLRVFLETAWAALESAGYDPRTYPGKFSLYSGAGLSSPLTSLDDGGENPAAIVAAITAAQSEIIPLRVAHELELRGESISVYTACSTSLVAVHMACQSLLMRQSDVALAGGVSVSLPERTGYLYQDGMILSPDGHCRAFDERARGTVGGNGAGMVVLKLLEDALRDGDNVIAVIRGSAINNDGGVKVGFTAPSVAGQTDVIRQALSYAEVPPETIGYVEAHGTGTSLGDPIEIEALTRAYREHTDRTGYCAVGSVKTNIGHLDTAAGVAGLIKAALVLSHGEIPPSLHFERPNPNIDFAASPFFVNATLSPFPKNGAPRRAAVSSFGIGGTNAHAVLEESPALPSGPTARSAHLFPLSARTPEALSTMAEALAAHMERHPEQPFADVAYTLAVGRRAFEHRHALVATDREDLCRKLRDELPPPLQSAKSAPSVAFLFPGQGSQAVGMGGALYQVEPLFRRIIDEADEVLRPLINLSLETVLSPHPDRRNDAEIAMARPDVAQPALLAVEFALAKLWASWGIHADAYLGHSLGEYTAACLSGVIGFEDALRVAHRRGCLTARTAEGRMLSVALSAESLAQLLSGGLSLAAINARDRSVVAGSPAEIEALQQILVSRKVPVSLLPVRHAFHSRLIEPVLDELRSSVGEVALRAPSTPYVSSRTGTWILPEEATDPALWAAQMREPVRFAAGLDTLLATGFTTLLEVGPDQALTLLARAHLGKQVRALPSLPRAASSTGAHSILFGSLGALWAAGAAPTFPAVYAEEKRRRVPLPTYPFARTRFPVAGVAARSVAVQPQPLSTPQEAQPLSPESALRTAPLETAPSAVPVPSQGGTVEQIAALWQDLLGVSHVDAQSSFLDLGGNSLMAAQAVTRLRDIFLVDIPLADLFDATTVGDLAARIDERMEQAGMAKTAPQTAAAEMPRPKPLARRIEPLGPTAPRPLSYVQERVLQLEALEPGTVALNMPLLLRTGTLDTPRLQKALDTLVARQEGLRTLYRKSADGQWTAVVHEPRSVPISFVDLPSGTLEERRAQAASLAAEDAERPLDIQNGSVLRALLLRIAEDEHHLLFTIHHIMGDTSSLFILGSELSEIYQALGLGQRPALPVLPVQYRDFAAWQRHEAAEGAFAEHAGYWRRQLADLPSLALVEGRVPAGREHLQRRKREIAWPAAITHAASDLGKRHGTTPFATVLAAYALLLSRYSLQDEVVIGTPIGNRGRPELAQILGYVAQSVAFRVRLGGEPTFSELLRRVHTVVMEAHQHSDMPFEALAPELGRTRDPLKVRLFDAAIVFHMVAAEMVEFSRRDFQPLSVSPSTDFGATLSHLALNVSASSEGIVGHFSYNPDVLEDAEAARLVNRLAALIEAAAAAPETPIGALPMAAEEDRAELSESARRWRMDERTEPLARALLGLPESAVIVEGNTTVRADEIERRAERVTRRLLAGGLARSAVVGLRLESASDTLAALLGTLRAGGTAMLLDSASPDQIKPAHVLDEIPAASVPDDASRPSLPSPSGPAMVARLRGSRQAFVLNHRNLAAYTNHLDELLGTEAGTLLAAGDRRLDRFWIELLWALGRGFSVVVPSADTGARLALRRAPEEVRRPMDFSLFYFAAGEDTGGAQKYRMLLDGARRADELGFRAIWTPERHFHPFGGMYPNPSVLSAALAASTRRIGLRAGSVVLPLHHPIRVAEEWSVVDNISDGRVGIALASGWHARDFVFAPGQHGRRREVMRKNLEQVRALWRGEEVRFSNGEGEVPLRIYPRPVQRELPVWLTSGGTLDTFVLAGELGANLLTNLMGQKLDDLVGKIAAYRRAWEEHGHGPGRGHVTLMLHAFVSSDLGAVRRTVREPLLAYLRSSIDVARGFAATAGIDAGSLSPRDLTAIVEHGFDRYLHESGLFGTPESCRERAEHVRRMDVDEIACLVDFGIPTETVIENFDNLAELMRSVNEGAVSPAEAEAITWRAASETARGLLSSEGVTHLQANPALVRALHESRDGAVAPTSCLLVHDGAAADAAWSGRRASSAMAVEPGAWIDTSSSSLAVLDRYGQPLPREIPGELAVVGSEVPCGYQGGEDARGDFLSPLDPSLAARRYRTGRMARRRHDGKIELLGSMPAGFRAPAQSWQKAAVRRAPPPIRRTTDRDHVPLSFSQQRLWFIDQLEPGLVAYNNASSVLLSGPLDVPALQHALQEIVARHEVWRTAILTTESGDPEQRVLPSLTLDVPLVEIEGEDEAAKLAEIALRMGVLCRIPFDLQRPPLVKTVLFRLSDHAHVLGTIVHHIVSDGWTSGVFSSELIALYHAFRRGEPSPLAPLPVQYADYSVWQREWLTKEVLDGELGYWKKALEGTPTILDLPADGPRPPAMSYRGAREPVFIPAELNRRMNALARSKGATPFMALMATFAGLIGRWSGQDRFLFGTPTAGRSRPETEGLIGCFVNTLVLSADLTGDPSFSELLDRTRRTAIDAFGHMDLPFEKLVDAMVSKRDLGRAPLLQTMMVLHNTPLTAAQFEDLTLSPIHVDTGTCKLDLMLELVETPDGLRGVFEYATDIFARRTIVRLTEWLVRLLDAGLADPDAPLSRLSLADPAEIAQIAAWNDVAVHYPSEKCVHELFEEQARKTADAIAVEHDDIRLSYAELNAKANRLAHHLRRLGVRPEVRVGLCVERSLAMVVGLLAILKAGGAYVPLDPAYPAERLAFMLSDASVPVLLTQRQLGDTLPPHGALVVCLDADAWQWDLLPETTPESGAVSENLAYVIYTSGSTGKPKGVALQHRGSVAFLRWTTQAFSAEELRAVIASTSLSFDVSFFELFAPLVRGGRVLLLKNVMEVRNANLAEAEWMLVTVPSAARALVEGGALPPQVRRLNLAGEALDQGTVDLLFARSPELECIRDLYGPSEDTTYSTCSHRVRGGRASIGRPITNTRAHVLDSNLQVQPVGVPGELFLSGLGLARGYLGRSGLTAERFVPDPFSSEPGARMYRTGDLARWNDEGELEFLGRIDQQVKLRGFRIELGEIEAALGACPLVRASLVVAREDTPGDKRLVAYVVPAAEACTPSALREHLGTTLPDYMVPSAFVLLDALPLTPNGKVDRKALPAPEATRDAQEASFVAPRTPTERVLTALWEELLGVGPIGIHDDFFALGGHSLLAVRLMSQTQAKLGRAPAMASLFQHPTITALAAIIDGVSSLYAPAATLPLRAREAGTPAWKGLSGAERRLWFLQRLYPGTRSYQVPNVFRIEGPLSEAALRASFALLTQRHEILRTTYPDIDGSPARAVASEATLPIRIEDISALAGSDRGAAMRSLVVAEVETPFDLERGPLTRVLVVRLSDEDHVVVLHAHHITTDEWSQGVLMREWAAIYEAAEAGRELQLPPITFHYAEYARAEAEASLDGTFAPSRSYWKEHLSGLPRLDLPFVQTFAGDAPGTDAFCMFRVPTGASHSLGRLARANGCTLFMAWYAVFAALLSRYSGQTDFGVGSVITNRETPGTESMAGFFTNTVVLRTDLAKDPTFLEVLSRARGSSIDAYRHQALPFDVVVQDQEIQRHAGENPLYDVSFSEVTLLDDGSTRFRPFPDALEKASTSAKEALSMAVVYDAEGTLVQLSHDTSRVARPAVERLLGHLRTLLEDVIAHPEKRLSELALLTPVEVAALAAGSGTTSTYPSDQCVHELFEAQATRTPDAVAVEHGGSHLTYTALNQRANRLAHHLRRLGVGPEVRVGLCVERSFEMVIGLLAILKAGGAYVPLDPAYPTSRLAFMVNDASVAVLLTQATLVDKLPAHGARTVCLDRDASSWAELPATPPRSGASPDNAMYVTYTSGSTGQPKGVLVTGRGVVSLLSLPHMKARYQAPCKVLQRSSISFDTLVVELLGPLLAGACVALLEPGSEADTHALARAIRERGITYVDLPPTLLRYLLEEPDFCQAPSLRLVNVGGEALSAALIEAFEARCTAELWNAYGPTEATVEATLWPVDRQRASAAVRIGRPLPNYRAYVLDQAGSLVPIGVRGELFLAGVGLARGYLDRPALTASRFVPDPFSLEPGARMYRTGDLVRWDEDGLLEFLGRADDQIKIRGYRVEFGEIEAVLSAHPAVRACSVIARDQARLTAYVAADKATTQGELREHLRGALPDYMVPSAFMVLEALPLTSAGKIDRKALSALTEEEPSAPGPFEAPSTEAERAMAAIWREVLGVEQIGIHEDFFALGGNSILTLRVVSLAARAGLSLSPRQLFAQPTIAALSKDFARPAAALDLAREVVLPDDLRFVPRTRARTGEGVFLTGASGFVGGHVLRRLLLRSSREVHCLVRGKTEEDARTRLYRTLDREGLSEAALARVRVIPGDLDQPLFGLTKEAFDALSERIAVVIHSGAKVNHLAPYETMKAANVMGTATVLRLCAQAQAALHHLSTTDVFKESSSGSPDSPMESIEERARATRPPPAESGYAASKWVSEQLVLAAGDKGLPLTVYRLGLLGGGARSGALPLRHYWLTQALRMRLVLGIVPERSLQFLPCDFAADFIAENALDARWEGGMFHLDAEPLAPEEQASLVRGVTGRGRVVPVETWKSEVRGWVKSTGGYDEGYELLVSLFGQGAAEGATHALTFSTQRARRRASDLNLPWPEDHAPAIDATLRFIQRHHEAEVRGAAAPRRQPTSIAELRGLLADMNAHAASQTPAPLAVRPKDVFVATFPKCGTTWTQQIVHGLRTRGSMDFPEISYAVPFLDNVALTGVDLEAPQAAEPRAFKTHLPWSDVPKGGRYIYVMRDPRDALLSAYHFFNGWYFERDALDLREFSEEMFFDAESEPHGYWRHLRSFWEHHGREDVLFLCFEDMLQDPERAVRRIAAFAGIAADEDLIALATRQSSIDFMRVHKDQFDERQSVIALSRLMGLPLDAGTTKVRSGRAGEGKKTLPLDVLARLDEAWRREIEAPLGIRSYDELRSLCRSLG